MNKSKKIRHVLGISGGKDSVALAIYLKQQGNIPEMEYHFSDTELWGTSYKFKSFR
jgi:tRNA(Ile)-lysidine synthase TilS/MesJ